MIVNLRGPNGAGKTRVVRELLRGLDGAPVCVPGRRMPIGVTYGDVFVLGHYSPSAVNGGFDTITRMADGYEQILEHHRRGLDVLYEGKVHAADLETVLAMGATLVYLTTSWKDCALGVRERGHRIPVNVMARVFQRHVREREELRRQGCLFHEVTRDSGVAKLWNLLGGRLR